MTDPAPRRPTWKRRLALLFASSLCALVVAEIGFRLRFGTPLTERLPVVRIEANPLRGWQMVPGDRHYTYQHPVRINALGLRGPEVGPKQEREVRVLALGDSMTYGQGVAEDESLPAFLEQALDRQDPEGRPWTVLNSGHRGYSTNQELGVLEELGPAVEPDVVVLFWYWNDLTGRDIEDIYRRFESLGPIAQDVNAPMEGWTKFKWHALQLARRSALVMTLHDVLKSRTRYPYDEIGGHGLKRLTAYYQRWLTLCKRSGAQPILAVIPDASAVRGPHPTVDLADSAAKLARERGIPVISLLEPMRRHLEETGRVPVLPYDGHYDVEGNRVMGEFLATALLTGVLAPASPR